MSRSGRNDRTEGRRVTSTGGAFLTVGASEGIGQGASLIRAWFVANLVGPDQMGIAFTMLLFGEFLNRLTNLNPGITLVQDPAGGSGRFRHTLQAIMLLRGILFGALIALLAWPLSIYFEQEENLLGFVAVGLFPLLGGFIHVDIYKELRKRNYVPTALVHSIPSVVSLAATFGLCLVFQNFWLPIAARIVSSVTSILVSFGVARRRFALCFDKRHAISIIKFMLPLAGAGILVFFSNSGPKLFLASAPTNFGSITADQAMVMVGVFGVAMMLCVLPSSIGSRIISQTWSPHMARMRDDPNGFRRMFKEMQTVSYMLAAATIILLGAGDSWGNLLFPEKFEGIGGVVSVLSIYGGLRLGRVAMRAAALSTGRSGIIFWCNLASLVGLAGTLVAIIYADSLRVDGTSILLEVIAGSLILGEISSLVVGNILLDRGPLALGVRDLWLKPLAFCAAAVVTAAIERALVGGLPLWLGAAISVLVTAGMIVLMFVTNSNVRDFVTGRSRAG